MQLTNISSMYDKTVSAVGYVVSGVGAHGVGAIVEAIAMGSLKNHQLIRVPVAKMLHEVAECFISASSTINIYQYNEDILGAIKHVTRPIWETPVSTILSGLGSWAVESMAVKALGLHDCCSCHGHHHHHHAPGLFSMDTLIKGLASTFGSWSVAYAYDSIAGDVSVANSTDSSL